MGFLELLRIEFMKVRRSKILPILFIPPLLVVISGVASMSMYLAENPGNAWQAMFVQSSLLFGYYLLPFSMVVTCVLISQREKQNKGILKMLSLPIDRHKTATAKFLVLLFYLAVEILIFFLFFIVAGFAATEAMGINEALPVQYVFGWSALLFATAVPCTALIWLITVLFKNPLFSIGGNLFLVIPGVLAANTPIWFLYPHCYSGYVVTTELSRLSTDTPVQLSNFFLFIPCAIAILLTCVFTSNKRFGKNEMK